MKYYAEIDGLRAIAVLLVLIYHGGLTLFPSGFVGVDIFFVISGFLITRIIDNELKNNQFSFVNFYTRRIWRLQPVLIFSMFVATILSLVLFLPQDLIQYCRGLRDTLLFKSNYHFGEITTGYFAASVNQLPLLHTWSLSIEWQCYIVLPIVYFICYRVLGDRHTKKIIYLCTAGFFLLSMYYSRVVHPEQAYYMFSSRFFEFLLGSCAAISSFSHVKMRKYIFSLLGILAPICIFYIASKHDIQLGYPNYYALIVCLATGVLLALGQSHPQHIMIRLLSIKPFVFIGVLSYSLYLWHWIIFAFIRYQNIVETPQVLILVYILTGIFSYSSWRFVERRFHYAYKKRKSTIVILLLPIGIAFLMVSFAKKYEGFPQRFGPNLASMKNAPRRPKCMNDGYPKAVLNSDCQLGAYDQKSKTAFMIGDSFSNHSWGFMDILGKASNVSIFAQAMPACLALPEIYILRGGKEYTACHEYAKHSFKMIKNNHYNYVIIGENWLPYLSLIMSPETRHLSAEFSLIQNKKHLRNALDNALQIIIDSGAKPVLISYPALIKNYDCFYNLFKRFAVNTGQCNFDLIANNNTQWFDSLFIDMAHKYPSLSLIDPKKLQCVNNKCSPDINGCPMYRDGSGHITDFASTQLGKKYLDRYINPLSNHRGNRNNQYS